MFSSRLLRMPLFQAQPTTVVERTTTAGKKRLPDPERGTSLRRACRTASPNLSLR